MISSTRSLICAEPLVSDGTSGLVPPKPRGSRRFSSMPYLTSQSLSTCARFCDSSMSLSGSRDGCTCTVTRRRQISVCARSVAPTWPSTLSDALLIVVPLNVIASSRSRRSGDRITSGSPRSGQPSSSWLPLIVSVSFGHLSRASGMPSPSLSLSTGGGGGGGSSAPPVPVDRVGVHDTPTMNSPYEALSVYGSCSDGPRKKRASARTAIESLTNHRTPAPTCSG